MSEVVVFGGTGLFGRAIASELRSRGASVRVATRRAAPISAGMLTVDLRSVSSIARAVEGIDAVVICMPLSDGPRGGFVPERDGVRNILAALSASPDAKVLKLSEIGAGTDPSFFDLQCKADSDEAIARSGRRHVVIRPTWVMEAWPNQLQAARGVVLAPTCRQSVHWVSVRDVARWFAEALAKFEIVEGRALIAQGPEKITFAEAARRFARATSGRVAPFPTPLLAIGAPFSPRLRTLYELFRYYDRAPEAFEAEETWRLLGAPTVRFDDFVAELAGGADAQGTRV